MTNNGLKERLDKFIQSRGASDSMYVQLNYEKLLEFILAERSSLLEGIAEKIEKEKKKIYIEYPDTKEGRQSLHENRLFINGLDTALSIVESSLKD